MLAGDSLSDFTTTKLSIKPLNQHNRRSFEVYKVRRASMSGGISDTSAHPYYSKDVFHDL